MDIEKKFNVRIELETCSLGENLTWKAKLYVGDDYEVASGYSWKEALTSLLAKFKD